MGRVTYLRRENQSEAQGVRPFPSSFEALAEMGKVDPNKVIILDAGHGGINPITQKYVTSGKRSSVWEDGSVYYEGVGNRDIVKQATRFLKEKGWTVLFTVDPDNHKDVGLSKRVEIANKHYRKYPKAFLISVHSNGVEDVQAHGTEVYTSPGFTKSDLIAPIWMKEFNKYYPGIKRRLGKYGKVDKEAKFTVIYQTKCPAILIETMFHSNPKECKILMNPLERARIGKVICNTAEQVFIQKVAT